MTKLKRIASALASARNALDAIERAFQPAPTPRRIELHADDLLAFAASRDGRPFAISEVPWAGSRLALRRALADLVDVGRLARSGDRRGTRYYLPSSADLEAAGRARDDEEE